MASSSPTGPQQPLDPFEPTYSRIRWYLTQLRHFLDIQELRESSEKILQMPPEERFTNSIDIFRAYMDDQHWIVNLLRELGFEDLNQSSVTELTRFVEQQLADVQEETLRRAINAEQTEGYLVVAVYLQIFEEIVNFIGQYFSNPEIREQLGSCYVAFLSRLIVLEESNESQLNEELIEDLIEDIQYGAYHLRTAIGAEIERHPSETELEELKRETLFQGALFLYDRFDMPAQDAAEMANIPPDEFINEIDLQYQPQNIQIQDEDNIKILNEVAIRENTSRNEIVNRAIEEYLEENIPSQEWEEDLTEDPFFTFRDEVIANFDGEGPETDASALEDQLYEDPHG